VASHDVNTPEPVVSAQTITILVGVVAAALGYTLNDTTVTAIAGGVWLVISILATLIARAKVAPIKGGWQQQIEQIIETQIEDTASRIVNQLAVPAPVPPQPASAYGLGRTQAPRPSTDPGTATLPTQRV
jgi:hypothetical protein